MVIWGEDYFHGRLLPISTTLSVRSPFLIAQCDKCLGKWRAGPNTSYRSGLGLSPPPAGASGAFGMGGHVQLSTPCALACSRSCSCLLLRAPTAIATTRKLATPSKNNSPQQLGREIVIEARGALALETVEKPLQNTATPRFSILHVADGQSFTFPGISYAKYIY